MTQIVVAPVVMACAPHPAAIDILVHVRPRDTIDAMMKALIVVVIVRNMAAMIIGAATPTANAVLTVFAVVKARLVEIGCYPLPDQNSSHGISLYHPIPLEVREFAAMNNCKC